MALLEIKDLVVNYGPINAIKGIDLTVEEGKIIALLGANGAGKTTTLRTISGIIKPTEGKILYEGKNISGKRAYKVARMGINQSPEGRLIFNELTVEDNLRVGAYGLKGIRNTYDTKQAYQVIIQNKLDAYNIRLSAKEIKIQTVIEKYNRKIEVLQDKLQESKNPDSIQTKIQALQSKVDAKKQILNQVDTQNNQKLEAYKLEIENVLNAKCLQDLEKGITQKVVIKTAKQRYNQNLDKVYKLFPILKERSKQNAGTLSGGEQQMLAIGRALMASPKLLLLDEPSLGLAPLVIKQIFEALVQIKKDGTTILIVEQNALATLKISDYAYVLELGAINLQGEPKELLTNKRLVEAYLGGKTK